MLSLGICMTCSTEKTTIAWVWVSSIIPPHSLSPSSRFPKGTLSYRLNSTDRITKAAMVALLLLLG